MAFCARLLKGVSLRYFSQAAEVYPTRFLKVVALPAVEGGFPVKPVVQFGVEDVAGNATEIDEEGVVTILEYQ